MPEEINRIVTDSITDLFLVTEQSGVDNLRREGCNSERIYLVGNLMIDSLQKNLRRARESNICERVGVKRKNYGVVTLHRPANVDERDALSEILSALGTIAEELPLVWPMHPRVKAQLASCGVSVPANIALEEPLGYLDFLCLEANSAVVLTDSGGVQEETTALGIDCLTLRENTERPVTIELGTNRLAGTKSPTILAAWKTMRASPPRGVCPPLWDGRASERCLTALRNYFLAEPKHNESAVQTKAERTLR
jgi:UDP-N-acetylglucosamine 2-epimerase (non-hydrolysing)